MATQPNSYPCWVCTMHLKYDICEYFFPFQFFCPHRSHRFSLKPCYKLLKPYLLLYVSFGLYLWYAVYSYFAYVSLACDTINSSCIMFVSDLVFVVGSTLIGVALLVKSKTNFLEIDSWLCIFEHLRDYDLQDMIDNQATAKFKFLRMFASGMVIAGGFSVFLWIFYAYDSLPGSFIRKSAICLCYIYQSLGLILLLQRTTLVGTILRQLKKNIGPKFRKQLSVKKYQNLLSVLHTNMSLLLGVIEVILFMWSLISTTSLIFNIFISIKYKDYDVPNLILLNLRTVVTFLSIVAILQMSEVDINRKVS
ncbi:hypothetical protein Zmor_008201 [Zophobas morio]|uniref:Uncharacterized protein n=1 Tax=Zophobas morio TaxID=2755281 RepID=A0AA38IZT5_9CUCU|nr:hypothetical protein Zmor_008201 [Zophobas morio]